MIYEGTIEDYRSVLACYQGTGDDPLGLQLRSEFPPDSDE